MGNSTQESFGMRVKYAVLLFARNFKHLQGATETHKDALSVQSWDTAVGTGSQKADPCRFGCREGADRSQLCFRLVANSGGEVATDKASYCMYIRCRRFI